MDLISILVIILGSGYLLYLIIESFLIHKYRKSLKYVIHVNGIRGKSTITKLIDSGLREFGYRVYSKATGTIPTIIDCDGNEKEVKRLGPANIKEQVKILRNAYKQKAEILVIECMAVNKDLQYVCEHNILKSNITIISNVREDHIKEMGENKFELAVALANTTPKNGYLIINNGNYNEVFENACIKNHSKLIIANDKKVDDLDTFSDNIAVALEVANILNLDKDKYYCGMGKYKRDIGSLSIYKLNNSTFINGFAINDIDSIKIIYDKLPNYKCDKPDTLLINNRFDRPTRVESIINGIGYFDINTIIVTGSNTKYTVNKIKSKYPNKLVLELNEISDLENYSSIFAIGNIAYIGWEIIEYYKKGEKLC